VSLVIFFLGLCPSPRLGRSRGPYAPLRSLAGALCAPLLRQASTARFIASILAATSSSVVAHDDTLTRIAVRPCHSVPPHQHTPSRWMRSITARVNAGGPNEPR